MRPSLTAIRLSALGAPFVLLQRPQIDGGRQQLRRAAEARRIAAALLLLDMPGGVFISPLAGRAVAVGLLSVADLQAVGEAYTHLPGGISLGRGGASAHPEPPLGVISSEPIAPPRCLASRCNESRSYTMRQTCKIVGGIFATVLLAAPIAATAQVSLDVTVAPPAPRYEVVPPPRAGYVWAPGYWNWNSGQWGWSGGRWIVVRPGYRWVPDEWVENGPRWRYVPGHWVR
jgi:hypothetical protein